MRLKVTGDTFFLSDSEGAVFLRNNRGSLRLEGGMIDRWIEQLMPMFNGEHTLHELTDGLPEAHRNRVYEIAKTLLQNGFVRDVSSDRPSRLSRQVQKQYAAQIDFLDSLAGSGAWRFERYREARVLAAGGGSMLTALVSALLSSGLPKIRVCPAGSMPDRRRILQLAAEANGEDPEAEVQILAAPPAVPQRWRDLVASYDAVLWASAEEDMKMFRMLHQACRLEKKWMLPALFIEQIGLAGPIVSADAEGSWASAWRRLHRKALRRDPALHAPSATAESMLTNVIVFELFKSITGAAKPELRESCYLLNLETLEAGRYPFLPHPAETGGFKGARKLLPQRLSDGREKSPGDAEGLFAFFQSLTSPVTGIFHAWEEGDYIQLPVSLCSVQAADPLSDGPADLLPPVLCGGMTHMEARREAGLAGLESYAARWHESLNMTAVGVGESPGEGIGRAVYHALQHELNRRLAAGEPPEGLRMLPNPLEDDRCRFYFESLGRMGARVIAAAGEPVCGLPACFVKCGDKWHAAAGFTQRMALQGALLKAVMSRQAESDRSAGSPIHLQPAVEKAALTENLLPALAVMERHGCKADIYELPAEPFMKEKLSGVYGVVLSGEGTA
jgi:putative thiazole-containing bacteriocin maturation protein